VGVGVGAAAPLGGDDLYSRHVYAVVFIIIEVSS
jgi:hypothetical protein